WLRLRVIRSRIASWTRSCAGRRQIIRTSAGGAKATRNASALAIPSAELINARTEYDWLVAAAAKSVIVSSAAAKARIRIRRRATAGWPRPARQSRVAATEDSTVQWTKKPTRYAMNQPGRGCPGSGKWGSANVQTIIATVISPSALSDLEVALLQ